MKIKTKLTLGIGSLFLMIMLLTAVGSTYINALKSDTENILVANYNTLEYSRNMIMALDETVNKKDAVKRFEESLKKQQNNITEIGEKEATEKLTQHFKQFLLTPDEYSLQTTIRNDLAEIMRLNMDAIQRKSNIATKTAKDATTWIAISSTICFLISFVLLLNLPGNIANPIKELTESIKQIADKNYNQRVHFVTHGEFGELARSFNVMAEKLEEYNNSNLFKLLI
jgi:nitrate/nitrite-specific signal transduction histidine kinase